MKKIFNKIKKDQKFYYGFILGLVLCVTFTVSAAIMVAANQVSLSSSKTSKTNVQDALDELYDKTSVCITCSAGTYADNDLKQCVLCTAGTYSTGMSNSCTSCPDGYTSDQAATGPDKCYLETMAGKYIAVANDTTQSDCPAGSYCPSTKIYYGSNGGSVTCPDGYTSDAGATADSDCYIQTTAGKYIATSKSTTQTTCTAGYYCPSAKVYYGNTGSMITCGANNTSPAGASQASQCRATSYTYTKSSPAYGTDGSVATWVATYSCNTTTGIATMGSCAYSGGGTNHGSATCDGGINGFSPTYMCTSGTGELGNPLYTCSDRLSSGDGSGMGFTVYGGGLPGSESCS